MAAKKQQAVKFNSTVGINVYIGKPGLKLVSFSYDQLEDGSYLCYVKSARTLATLNQFGKKILFAEKIDEIVTDNDIETFHNFCDIFGIK